MSGALQKLDKASYRSIIEKIEKTPCGTVYPLSVAERFQHGDIYTDGDSVLLRHYCGFAYVFGPCGSSFLEEVYELFLSPNSKMTGRFVLFSAEPQTAAFFRGKQGIRLGKRYSYEYPHDAPLIGNDPSPSFRICPFDSELFDTVPGRITPRFSWREASCFLEHGMGYCVLHQGKPVSWAFSAAVSRSELDIGIETVPDYRHMGLGLTAAGKMIEYCLEQHKRPVWACDANNAASQHLAERAGFVKTAEYTTIRKAQT